MGATGLERELRAMIPRRGVSEDAGVAHVARDYQKVKYLTGPKTTDRWGRRLYVVGRRTTSLWAQPNAHFPNMQDLLGQAPKAPPKLHRTNQPVALPDHPIH